MSYEIKENSGSLFKNDRKEKEGHPDYKGSANISGLEYWVSAWINKTKDGKSYMSFKYQPKDSQQAIHPPKPAEAQQQPEPDQFAEDLPF